MRASLHGGIASNLVEKESPQIQAPQRYPGSPARRTVRFKWVLEDHSILKHLIFCVYCLSHSTYLDIFCEITFFVDNHLLSASFTLGRCSILNGQTRYLPCSFPLWYIRIALQALVPQTFSIRVTHGGNQVAVILQFLQVIPAHRLPGLCANLSLAKRHHDQEQTSCSYLYISGVRFLAFGFPIIGAQLEIALSSCKFTIGLQNGPGPSLSIYLFCDWLAPKLLGLLGMWTAGLLSVDPKDHSGMPLSLYYQGYMFRSNRGRKPQEESEGGQLPGNLWQVTLSSAPKQHSKYCSDT